ncbi:hypothetical protein [Helicobacter sp. 23-1046]
MTRTFNKIGKIVAVSIGIVLMGAVFASTKADNVIECSGNEIKTDTSIEKGECEDGKRKGVWKYYDKDGYIQKEITWQNGEIVLQKEYDKDENLKLTTAYNKGEVVSKRKYSGYNEYNEYNGDYESNEYGSITHYYTEDNVSIEREYSIGSLISKENNKIYEARKEAAKIVEQRAQSKVKKPTMQEVKRAKDRKQDAMKTYREKLSAQYEKEWQIELAKIPTMPNFDSYSNDELITYIKNNKISPMREVIKFVKFSPTIEGDTTENLILLWRAGYDILFKDTEKKLGKIELDYLYNDPKDSCEESYSEHYTCRTFAKHYKQLIDKSAYKDRIYKALPKPKNL